jgi:CHAT domain-containing protein/tetratricopeptide (TPR) repeat protein
MMSHRYPWGLVLLVCLSFVPEVAMASSPVLSRLIAQTDIQAQKLFDEGMALFNQGTAESYQQAIIKLEAALPLWRKLGDKSEEAKTLVWIGFVYDKLGFKAKALEYYNQALPIYQTLKDLRGIGDTLNNTGLVYRQLGKYPQALKSYQQALEVFKEISDLARQGTTFNNIGLVHQYLSQYSQALENFQKALAIFRELRDHPSEGITLNNIALTYQSLGQYDDAMYYFQAGLVLRSSVSDISGQQKALMNIGSVYTSLGQCNKALYVYQQAIAITQQIGDRLSEGIILGNIGSVYECLGNYSKALDYYQQALPLWRAVGDRFREGIILNNIAVVYGNLGQHRKALDYLEQALTIIKQVGDRLGEGTTLNNIGKIYYALRQYQQAIESYQQSLAIFREIGNREGEGLAISNIGLLLAKQKQPQLAIIFYKQSVNVYETLRGDIKGLSKELQQSYTETVANTYRRLSDLLLEQDRILEAQRVLDLLKVQELDDYLRIVRGNDNTEKGIVKLPPEQKIDAGIESILAKAVNIGQEISQLQERQKLNGQLTPSEQERLAQLWQQQEKIVDNFNQFIESPEVIALINQLKPQTRSADLLNKLDNLNGLPDNLKNLHQNAVLLYPLILEDRLELILTTPDSPPVRRTVKVTKKELNETILAFRKALKTPLEDAKKPAQKLYQWLIQPIENDLKTAQAKTIIYAPDGQLRYIPLAALYDGKQWLIERYRINNITAASLTDFNTKPEPKMQVLAGAFIQGNYKFKLGEQNFNFSGLPFAGKEINQLADNVSATTKFIDKDFNPQIIPQMDSYTIVHWATHAAFVVGTPEQSFVLFGDGSLVTLKDMKKWQFKNLDLIVLSGCETGLGGNFGTGIEILGLGYQLQNAGARAVIASLWSVDDGGTQALMNAFYAALKTGKYSKAEALQQAQVALINSNNSSSEQQRGPSIEVISNGVPGNVVNRLSHPYYWSPFILIGNGL